MNVRDIRAALVHRWYNERDYNPQMIELIGTSFLADEPAILGSPNEEYIARELEWYEDGSLNVNDFPGEPPKIWKEVASPSGWINSNYGHLVYSAANGSQYSNVLSELKYKPDSRRGVMVYTRPSIHRDATRMGMNDFICTNAVNYFVRHDAVHAVVQMRSNDVVFGYRNDFAWQKHVLRQLAEDLEVEVGTITWQAASLHVYPRHFYLLEELAR